jgi:hypothetical protein
VNRFPTRTVALFAITAWLVGAPSAIDQRGVSRPQERRCDMGAYERRV